MRTPVIALIMLFLTVGLAPSDAAELKHVAFELNQSGATGFIPLALWQVGQAVARESDLIVGPYSVLRIKVKASGGKWVGISFRDSDGTVYDVPAHKASWLGTYDAFEWRVPTSFENGALEVTVALWEGYDAENDKMMGELDRLPWTKVGQYEGFN